MVHRKEPEPELQFLISDPDPWGNLISAPRRLSLHNPDLNSKKMVWTRIRLLTNRDRSGSVLKKYSPHRGSD